MGLLQTFVVQLKRNVFYSFEKQILLNIQMSLHSSTFKWKIFKKMYFFLVPRFYEKKINFDIIGESVGTFVPPLPPPQILWIYLPGQFCLSFCPRGGRGGREWLSCHVHLNIRTFCSKGKVEKKLVRVGTLVFSSDCILLISVSGKFPKTVEKL